jgi:hypothetical protein
VSRACASSEIVLPAPDVPPALHCCTTCVNNVAAATAKMSSAVTRLMRLLRAESHAGGAHDTTGHNSSGNKHSRCQHHGIWYKTASNAPVCCSRAGNTNCSGGNELAAVPAAQRQGAVEAHRGDLHRRRAKMQTQSTKKATIYSVCAAVVSNLRQKLFMVPLYAALAHCQRRVGAAAAIPCSARVLALTRLSVPIKRVAMSAFTVTCRRKAFLGGWGLCLDFAPGSQRQAARDQYVPQLVRLTCA